MSVTVYRSALTRCLRVVDNTHLVSTPEELSAHSQSFLRNTTACDDSANAHTAVIREAPSEVAYKRVIDYVPVAIDHSFLSTFSERLRERLFERLELGGANASERCSGYIAEAPGIVAQRDELVSKKKRLENVQQALFNFGL
ncbi:hypothetical protein C8Q70DRAFT_933379 [Cubamyces menziesii]|nr:hypothetical protein C8Q70DRAFT_933379 [Cubamyces menziesii]